MRAAPTIAVLTFGVALGCAQGGGGDSRSSGRPDGGTPPRPDAELPGIDAGPMVGMDSAVPGVDSAVPGVDSAVPGVDSAVPGVDSAVPGVDSAVPGVDAGPSDPCLGVDCSGLDTACTVGVCDPGSGACASAARPEGTGCDDGDACTAGDACASGVCTGSAVDCSALDGACGTGVCDPALGCVSAPVADGTSCDTDPGDCVDEACASGSCASAPRADCSSCGSAGEVCSAGACGAPPTSRTFDFEAGLPSGWRVGGDAGWVVDTSRPHAGAMSAHSGAISSYDTSTMTADVTIGAPARLSFWLTTSTESGYDYLEVWIDGVRQGRWSGSVAWTEFAIDLAAGAHTIEWRYTKDGSVSSGDDRVWIDDVVLSAGGGVPVETFEAAGLPSGWTSSGSASWTVGTSAAHGGAQSARSGAITHSQQTSLTRTVTLASAGTLRFWYSVSSESSFDYLRIFIDGVEQDRWAGSVSWTQASYPLAAGSHTIEWRYTKDGSVSSGSDAAWLDDVELGDPLPPTGSLCGP